MDCTNTERDLFFDDLLKENDTAVKAKERFVKYQNHRYLGEKYDFDAIAVDSNLSYMSSGEDMIDKFDIVNYGCNKCKCLHYVPMVSSDLLIEELRKITNKTIINRFIRKKLVRMVMTGIHQEIIPVDYGNDMIDLLKKPSYNYIDRFTMIKLFSYLSDVAKECYNPKYVMESRSDLNKLIKHIPTIKEWSMGYDGVTIYAEDEHLEDIKKLIDMKDGWSSEWFKYEKPQIYTFEFYKLLTLNFLPPFNIF